MQIIHHPQDRREIEMAHKSFGQFSLEARGKAIQILAAKGHYVWDQNFDPNADEVLNLCRMAEMGNLPKQLPEKAQYTFTPEMLEEIERRRRIMQ